MNPLTVLKGGTLMRPASDLVREPGSTFIQLDRAGRCRCQLDEAGKPINLMVNGRPGEFVTYSSDLDLPAIAESNIMVTGLDRTPMRAAVTVRQQTKRPMILLGDDGALLGVVGEHEIYRGMLRQTEYAKVSASDPNSVAV